MKISGNNLSYLAKHIVKTIDFPDFMEVECGCTLKWVRHDMSAKCNCPMPDHPDKNASFYINKMESDVFVYNCFGCGSKGNIIHFCRDYFNLRNKVEAINFLCKKLKITNSEDIFLEGLKNLSHKVDTQRKLENENILVSNQCRMLLRKNFDKNKSWVAKAYKKLNLALDNEDLETIESIGHEASKKIYEK